MAKQPYDVPPPWRDTPLDHWTADIDPAIMAGDEWVDNGADPGMERIMEGHGGTVMREPFMHPMHDATYGLEIDSFTSEGES